MNCFLLLEQRYLENLNSTIKCLDLPGWKLYHGQLISKALLQNMNCFQLSFGEAENDGSGNTSGASESAILLFSFFLFSLKQ